MIDLLAAIISHHEFMSVFLKQDYSVGAESSFSFDKPWSTVVNQDDIYTVCFGGDDMKNERIRMDFG